MKYRITRPTNRNAQTTIFPAVRTGETCMAVAALISISLIAVRVDAFSVVIRDQKLPHRRESFHLAKWIVRQWLVFEEHKDMIPLSNLGAYSASEKHP
jgi:hypothetical protein